MQFINSGIKKLRDPFMLIEDGVFYLYGSQWLCHKNTTGKLDSGWDEGKKIVEVPTDFEADDWAPEVHRYNGAYYMFTTYRSTETHRRGCAIFKAEHPYGPFKLHSNGHVTPRDWSCIDGTLHIDSDGQPWMVFVNEHTHTDDHIGRFAAARLSEDLTRFISEPFELFRADSFEWTDRAVTDGCFTYTTKSGSLLMLWSNFIPDKGGYATALVRSDNGRLDGNWSHERLLFSRQLTGEYDGGHGMFFELDGQLWLSIHSPNNPQPNSERMEMPIFVRVKEENDTVVSE